MGNREGKVSTRVAMAIVVAGVTLALAIPTAMLLPREGTAPAPEVPTSQTSNESLASSGATASSTSSASNSTSSLNALDLVLEIRPAVDSNNLTVTVMEVNTLDVLNNVSQGEGYPYYAKGVIYLGGTSVGLNPVGGCDMPQPVGFAIFQGYYDASNFTSGSYLMLHQPQALHCTITSGGPPSTYLFGPDSNVMSEIRGGQLVRNDTVSLTRSVGGYWAGSAFHAFGPGTYTVLAGDQWERVKFLYFTVSASGAISTDGAVVAR